MTHPNQTISRRTVLGAAAAAAGMGSLPVWAQDKAAIQFATLAKNLALSADDFYII